MSHRAGRPYLVADVGLDDRGRPEHVRLTQQIRVLGARTGTLTGTTRYSGWGDSAPPPVDRPDPAIVARDADVDVDR